MRSGMRRESEPREIITVIEAARLLGVSAPTLRRWDAAGKFPARRHPMNGYRIYLREDVMRLRRDIACGR